MNAITPDEAIAQFKKDIPPEVISCWNEVIMNNLYVDKKYVESHFTLEELKKALKNKVGFDDNNKMHLHWLDLEDVFRDAGWSVKYDQPAYNESYEATFTFKKK